MKTNHSVRVAALATLLFAFACGGQGIGDSSVTPPAPLPQLNLGSYKAPVPPPPPASSCKNFVFLPETWAKFGATTPIGGGVRVLCDDSRRNRIMGWVDSDNGPVIANPDDESGDCGVRYMEDGIFVRPLRTALVPRKADVVRGEKVGVITAPAISDFLFPLTPEVATTFPFKVDAECQNPVVEVLVTLRPASALKVSIAELLGWNDR